MKKLRGYTTWLMVLVSLFIAGLVLARTGHLEMVEGAAFKFFGPVQNGFSSLSQWFSNVFQTAQDLRDLRERNRQLTELVNELVVENVRLKEVEAENAILRQLLHYAEANPGQKVEAVEVRARVIGREPNSMLQYIIIGAGSQNGLKAGMPVVTERGLVGRVEEVYENVAKVRLITDVNSSVNAIVQRTRATGIVRGQVGGRLILDYLPQGDDVVSVGDLILTSGLGGGYPRQLIIGQVTKLTQKDYEMFQQAEIRPTVDFDRLEIVLVITNFIPLKMIPESVSPAEKLPESGSATTTK